MVSSDSKKTIMLVEDDAWVADVYRQQLEQEGFEVAIAQHAQDAIDIMDELESVSLLMLDLFLPEHNGFAVLQHLQSYHDWQEIPVVIFSNVRQRDLHMGEEQWKDYGVVWYAEKSQVHPKEVVEKVKSLTSA